MLDSNQTLVILLMYFDRYMYAMLIIMGGYYTVGMTEWQLFSQAIAKQVTSKTFLKPLSSGCCWRAH